MLSDEQQVVRLKNDFYRDGFNKVIYALVTIVAAIAVLVFTSLYLFFSHPAPVTFATDNDWRIIPPVPVAQPYLQKTDLLQWVSDVVPDVFTYDFSGYAVQLKAAQQYFTATGWAKYLEILKRYANAEVLQSGKLFVNPTAAGAPFIVNQGLLVGRYSWWVQMPIKMNYSSADQVSNKTITVQVLVVRVPTLDNLSGVSIDNIIVSKDQGGQTGTNG